MEPFNMWGIFPNLGYEVFRSKDGWKVKMKYFQNVDTMRDLMSPVAKTNLQSRHEKDKDGSRCSMVLVSSVKQLEEL